MDYTTSKFQDATTERLWELSLDGGCDVEAGSACDGGLWAGLLHNVMPSELEGIDGAPEHIVSAILTQDTYGFIYSTLYDSGNEAAFAFDTLNAEIGHDYDD